MGIENEAERLARAWIDGWNAGKPDDLPLASNFVHTSPLGTVAGREKYLDWVRPLAAKNVTSLNIVRTLAGEGESAIWFEMMTPNGLVQVCDWVQTDNGKIVAITSFYDATDLPYRETDT
ncbi:MAG: nuclear transport factor 2 family protein [Nitrosopumilus sp.]|nr:nuclear transport factor 2 family protein [Gammaproteobacteria bacterium]MDH3835013.1 nuclear transport factor 2 family protein [Nitrosopumilus sp.]